MYAGDSTILSKHVVAIATSIFWQANCPSDARLLFSQITVSPPKHSLKTMLDLELESHT